MLAINEMTADAMLGTPDSDLWHNVDDLLHNVNDLMSAWIRGRETKGHRVKSKKRRTESSSHEMLPSLAALKKTLVLWTILLLITQHRTLKSRHVHSLFFLLQPI